MLALDSKSSLPPVPMGYAGIWIKPLQFDFGGWYWSALDVRAVFGLTGEKLVQRYEIGLFSLTVPLKTVALAYETKKTPAQKPPGENGTKPDKKSSDWHIGGTIGGGTLYNNRDWSPAWSLELTAKWRFLEVSADVALLNNFGKPFSFEYLMFAGGIFFAPSLSLWQPAAGIGFLYAKPDLRYELGDYHALYGYEPSTGFYLHLKPLRFALALPHKLRLMLSALELRYSPLFASKIGFLGEKNNQILRVDFLRVGVQYTF